MSSKKPSENEDEYFARLELERKKEWEKERTLTMEAAEKERLRELHYMKCPKCGMDLHTFEFRGIKLDRCVSCNGTWFDAGEMEELLGQEQGILGRVMSVFR
jgi:uncharacterized protein